MVWDDRKVVEHARITPFYHCPRVLKAIKLVKSKFIAQH
jgi:hypothetical protein